MKKFFYSIAILLILTINAQTDDIINEVPLIPRTELFGNPKKSTLRLSPNGKYLSYLANGNTEETKNILNIWVKKFTKNNDKQLTFDTQRPIRTYYWNYESNQILYLQDKNGDENWLLYGTDIKTGKTICYTPFENVQVRIVKYNKKQADKLLISINKDNPQLHDVYLLNLLTREISLVEKNSGKISSWVADNNLNIKCCLKETKDGGNKLLIKKNNEWTELIKWNNEDKDSSRVVCFDKDGKTLYLLDSRNSNTSKLKIFHIDTGNFKDIIHDSTFDISDISKNPDTYDIEAVIFNKDYIEWVILDPNFEKIYKKIREIDEGNLHIINRDLNQENWLICFEKDINSGSYYIYNTKTDKSRFLLNIRPELKNYDLSQTTPIEIESRDRLTLKGYLTIPAKKEPKNLPLILRVHGGPWTRDSWGYNPEVQWLANRGYAVLQINYRGSTGFGKSFISAGNKEWGRKMHNDLIDAVNWAIEKGIANPEKIAIYGGSYGGYAALAGAAFTPDVFCCAVDIVGVSNLLTLLNSIPAYWEVFRKDLYQKIGNPQTEEELLKERSPLFSADKIKIPLLIAQGAHDPRVKQAESEQIVNALKEKGLQYEYLLFEDEGHGFAKEENKMTFYKATEKFLAKHLGGRFEE